MYQDAYLPRYRPPPRPTAHLWLGSILCGVLLGLGAAHVLEPEPPNAQIALDIRPDERGLGVASAGTATLLADLKSLLQQLRDTQQSLAAARIQIADLERENITLRNANLKTAAASPPVPQPVTTQPVATAPVSTLPEPSKPDEAQPKDGEGGPFVPIHAAPSSGPKACWMRGQSMVSIYRIEIRDEGFVLTPTWAEGGRWPDEFAPVMAGFRGKPLGDRAVMSRDDFKSFVRAYYDFGAKQDQHCRFLVAVIKKTADSGAWDDGLELVERYFFKKIRGRGAEP